MKKIRNASLVALGFTLMAMAPRALACFPCYCNGAYIGCYTSVWACYNDCIATESRSTDVLEQLILGDASIAMSIDPSRCAEIGVSR